MNQPEMNTEFFGTPLLQWRGGSMLATEHLYQPFQRIERHEHNHPYVCVVLSGRYSERSEAGERECRAGAVLIHHEGSTHSDRFGSGEARLLMLKTQTEAEHQRFTEPQFFDSGPAAAIGARLHEEVTYSDDVTALAIEGLMLELTAFAHRQRIHRPTSPGIS